MHRIKTESQLGCRLLGQENVAVCLGGALEPGAVSLTIEYARRSDAHLYATLKRQIEGCDMEEDVRTWKPSAKSGASCLPPFSRAEGLFSTCCIRRSALPAVRVLAKHTPFVLAA